VLDGGDIADLELDIVTADGEIVTLEVNGTPAIEDGDVVGVHGVARDITDRKETLRELRIKDRAIDEAQAGITLADATQPDEPLVYVNQGFEEITGYDASSATGRNCRFLQGERTDPEAVATLRNHIDAYEPVSVELVNYRNDGTPFWNHVRITPVRDETGAVTHLLGIQNDVTEQKRWEQLFEVLNRVLRHNLRNDLGVVSGLGALLANRVDENDAELGQTIEQKAEELLDLGEKARDLEDIASRDSEPERIDVDTVLSDLVAPYRREHPDVTFDVSVRTDRALCVGDEIEEALSELIENAVKHNTAPEPRVTIDVRDADEWVVLSVEDNGPGINDMEANVISKGEEKALEHGSGLGLWLINWVVTRYGGSFQVRRRQNSDAGTRATVRLPGLTEKQSVEDVAGRPTILFW
jgi:PAS domain S-box-containing protein